MSEDDDPKSGDVGAGASDGQDVVIVHGVSDDGSGLDVLRLRNRQIEVGALQKLEHGRPIHGEVVRLKPRKACPLVCDVEVQVPDRARAPADARISQDVSSSADSRRGPAQVATDRYRSGWELIFGTQRKVDTVN